MAGTSGRPNAGQTVLGIPTTSPCARSRRATWSSPSRTRASAPSAWSGRTPTRIPSQSSSERQGRNWEAVGWRVDVEWHEVPTVVRPVEWMERLRPLLPKKYSPLLADGRGVQSVYLTELPEALALTLAHLVGKEVEALARTETLADTTEAQEAEAGHPELVVWEEHLRRRIESDPELPETEREALVLARRGQGLFRQRVQLLEHSCRLTGVYRPEHLRASHMKPWRDSDNAERLDGENGLLLTPSIDHLFDRGFLSFTDAG